MRLDSLPFDKANHSLELNKISHFYAFENLYRNKTNKSSDIGTKANQKLSKKQKKGVFLKLTMDQPLVRIFCVSSVLFPFYKREK